MAGSVLLAAEGWHAVPTWEKIDIIGRAVIGFFIICACVVQLRYEGCRKRMGRRWSTLHIGKTNKSSIDGLTARFTRRISIVAGFCLMLFTILFAHRNHAYNLGKGILESTITLCIIAMIGQVAYVMAVSIHVAEKRNTAHMKIIAYAIFLCVVVVTSVVIYVRYDMNRSIVSAGLYLGLFLLSGALMIYVRHLYLELKELLLPGSISSSSSTAMGSDDHQVHSPPGPTNHASPACPSRSISMKAIVPLAAPPPLSLQAHSPCHEARRLSSPIMRISLNNPQSGGGSPILPPLDLNNGERSNKPRSPPPLAIPRSLFIKDNGPSVDPPYSPRTPSASLESARKHSSGDADSSSSTVHTGTKTANAKRSFLKFRAFLVRISVLGAIGMVLFLCHVVILLQDPDREYDREEECGAGVCGDEYFFFDLCYTTLDVAFLLVLLHHSWAPKYGVHNSHVPTNRVVPLNTALKAQRRSSLPV